MVSTDDIKQRWLGKLAQLRLTTGRGACQGKAPHKPLLLLALIDLAESGELTSQSFACSSGLELRFRNHWSTVAKRWPSRPSIMAPLYFLSLEGLWQPLKTGMRSSKLPNSAVVWEMNPEFSALMADADFWLKARLVLIAKYFALTEQIELLDDLGLKVGLAKGVKKNNRLLAEAATRGKQQGDRDAATTIVTVKFDGRRFWISPDPANVDMGAPIVWAFASNRRKQSPLKWTVYFTDKTPFGRKRTHFAVVADRRAKTAIGPLSPEDPGHYKYGIKVEDAETDETLRDEDPHLIVCEPCMAALRERCTPEIFECINAALRLVDARPASLPPPSPSCESVATPRTPPHNETTLEAIHSEVREIKKTIAPLPATINQLNKGVETIRINTEAMARNEYDLRRENDELKRLSAGGYLNFVAKVNARDFIAFVHILVLGNRNKAADKLRIPQRSFYDQVAKWQEKGAEYKRMYDLVMWRKRSGRKISAPLGNSMLSGEPDDNPENPETNRAVLTGINEKLVDNRSYPDILGQVLEVMNSQNTANWPVVRKEVIEILKEELSQ